MSGNINISDGETIKIYTKAEVDALIAGAYLACAEIVHEAILKNNQIYTHDLLHCVWSRIIESLPDAACLKREITKQETESDEVSDEEIKVHPVQRGFSLPRDRAVMPQVVTMRAYEVYCEVFGPQDALVTGDCRGGLGVGELIAFLYARSFPSAEWRMRMDEAFKGMKL